MMKSDAYINLHKSFTDDNGLVYSLKSRESEDYGRVRHHAEVALLHDVTFVVQPSGLEKARETGQKNIHAFARGKVEAFRWGGVWSAYMHGERFTRAYWPEDLHSQWLHRHDVRAFTYTVEVGHFFLREDPERRPVVEASLVLFTPDGAFLTQPSYNELDVEPQPA